MTTLYTVHFQKGWRVGTRAIHMEHVEAATAKDAIRMARANFHGDAARGYKLTYVDHFDDDDRRFVRDM